MDKLTSKLREDAARIDAEVSAELDDRIRASLQGVTPATHPRRPERSQTLWWASSLTGVAVALGVIAVINLMGRDPEVPAAQPIAGNAVQQIAIPQLDLNAEAATLTSPLAEELENLQADLRKAEEVVRRDVRIDL